MQSLTKKLGLMIALGLLSACDKTERSFSLLQGESSFQQAATYVQRKIDILWVIDNSGSMASSQTALTTNFGSFINKFQTLSYDFNMAVTASDAWRGKYVGNDSLVRWRDGNGTTHSGVFVMNLLTPDLSNVFLTNATLGISGSGDERAFESFHDSLELPANSDFHRNGAYLAIIIVSDEDDFSSINSSYIGHNYTSPNLIPVSNYKDYLDASVGAGNYSVNAITIMDTACLDFLNASISGRIIGQRYMELADMTGGVKTSLCSDFGTSLELISDKIIELTSVFTIDREPIPGTIQVHVNGVPVLENSTNGWTFDLPSLTITFHGSSVPSEGASVSITYDPVAPKN